MRTATFLAVFLFALTAVSALVAEQGTPLPVTPGETTPGTTGATAVPPTTAPPPTTVGPTTPPLVAPRTTPGTTPRPLPAITSGDELIPFTFENMQLGTIIKMVSESTNRNFLIQTPISGTVLIYCPNQIPAKTAFAILGIILDSQGYTMVVTDDPPLIYVTKKAGAAPVPTEVLIGEEQEDLQKEHRLSTLVVVLKYVSVDDMQDILRNFKSASCVMTAYPAGNFLILKDDEASLKYLLSLIKTVDVPGTASKVTFRELKFADATETAALLADLLAERAGASTARPTGRPPTPVTRPGQRPTPTPVSLSPTIVGSATPLKITADQRTNRLIILASEKDTEYILGLVDEFDVEPTEDMYPVRTYLAQYQNAEDLADTLASFVTGQQRTRTGGRTTGRTQAAGRTTPATAPGGQATQAAARRGAVAGGNEEAFFLADPATNMVLIQAAPHRLDMYLNILKQLDQPQKQVLIEVWVVEVSSRSQLDIGVEFQSAEIGPSERIGPTQNEVFGGSNFDLGLGNLLSGTGFPSSGLSLGMRTLTDTKLNLGGKVFYVPNFDTFLRALQTDTNVNILSSPKLMTLNNETASVDVSDEISIAESSITSYAGLQDTSVPGGVTSTFRRTPVGITLEIAPQINSENSVIMDIDLSVGSIAGVDDISQAGAMPVIANRSTITKVRVDNGKTVVISGLRRADRTQSTSRVPLLGSIPILGMLFSQQSTLTVNTNLLIFITPHIVSDTLDMLDATDALTNQDLERERVRFQPVSKPKKRRLLPAKPTSGWEWKK